MQVLNLKIAGLFTNPNQFSEIPEGALIQADNIQIDKGSVAEPRRGQAKYGQMPSSYTGVIDALFEYNDRLLSSYNNKIAYDNGSGTFTAYTNSYSAQSGYRIKSTKANKNFYFTTTQNIKKISVLTDEPISAGVPRALDASLSVVAGSFLPNNKSVCYRFLWGYRDANDNLLLGAPSGRAVIVHESGGTKDVSVTLYIPDPVLEGYFFQAYRSANVDATIEPSDDLQLVYEGVATSTDITNGYVTFTDITPDDLRGAALYTNPTQEGILQANEEPPCAIDICTFKNMTFYGNTKGKQNIFITLIAVSSTPSSPSTTKLVYDDTITINGITYTAKATENSGSGHFAIPSTGTDASRIADTAKSLVKIINLRQVNVSAYYISNFGDLPGKIQIIANDYSLPQFAVVSSKAQCWNPVLQSSGTNNSSSNDVNPNRIYFSKTQQPEAVPILNYLDAGVATDPIFRIIPLRDSVFVLKANAIFRIIGEDPTSLRISLFDNTVSLIATESAVEMNNQIYCYTDQGMCAVSDNGIQIISRQIEDQIQQSEILTNFQTLSFGVSYEVDRKYILYCKKIETDTYPTHAYVFNFFTNAWTKYINNRSCGITFDNRLYMGGVDGYIYKERKQLNSSDYVDDVYSVTINSIAGNVITLASATNVAVNMVLAKGNIYSVITEVNGNNVTVESGVGFTTGSAFVYEAIESTIVWSQNSIQNPGILKHFREVTMLFRTADFSSIELGFSSNFDPNPEYTKVSPLRSDQWGSFPWGTIPWGFGSGLAYPIRTYVPLLKRRASWIFFKVRSKKAQSYFAIQGLSVQYENMSERFK
jgi:hypothetical protein